MNQTKKGIKKEKDMKELKFPLLNKDQIEVRVGQVSQKGCTLLLYKTSRTDSEILDKVIGAGNWQKRFYTLQGVGIGESVRSIVVCSVGIYDDDKHEWIWKDDSGTESQVEQDKGICSDAFKRAAGGSCWGIGRELYYTGFIFAKVPTQQKTNGKGFELADKFMSFEVKEISWYENPLALKTLVIVDNNGNVVFSKGSNEKVSQTAQKPTQNVNEYGEVKPQKKNVLDEATANIGNTFLEESAISQETKDKITTITGKFSTERYASFKNYLKGTFGVDSIGELTEENGKELYKILGGK